MWPVGGNGFEGGTMTHGKDTPKKANNKNKRDKSSGGQDAGLKILQQFLLDPIGKAAKINRVDWRDIRIIRKVILKEL